MRNRAVAVAVLLALGACGQGMRAQTDQAGAFLPARAPKGSTSSAGTYIQHVVLIVQENRSFDNLFDGFPGAYFKTYGRNPSGKKITLKPIKFQNSFGAVDIGHGYEDGWSDYDGGKMDGFWNNSYNGNRSDKAEAYAYTYVERSETKPYWTMAKEYTLADQMFPSVLGGSFTAHLDLIASTTNLKPKLSEVNLPTNIPWGCDAPKGTTTYTVNPKRAIASGPFPCFTQFRTLADTLDAAKVSWKYYAPSLDSLGYTGGQQWTEFDAIHAVRYGSDWKTKEVSPQTKVLTDIGKGKLADMTWVIPDFTNSDHLASNSDTGPSWVAAVVNAIGQSKYWSNTAIVVLWDDWGGWYDDSPPPQLDFRGLGIRVPCIVISPYARAGYVDHTQYEFGSIVKLVEEVFDLPALGTVAAGYTDARGTSMLDAFDFTQKPIKFKKIPAKYPMSFFLKQRASGIPPDTE